MDRYKIYFRNRENPIETVASEWNNRGNFIIFFKDEVEVIRARLTDVIALEKEVVE